MVNEGVSTQRDSRIDVLRNLFNRFKINDNENVQLTFDHLTDITNELQALGATEITKPEIIKKLLRSLDSSFDTLALMIQERPDFKTLDASNILERLNTYGPNYVRARALKAKVVSSYEEESNCSSEDHEDIGKEIAMLVKKFQKFTKKKGFRKSSRSSSRNDEASTRDHKKRTYHKCKKPGHYISECPQWDNEIKKKKKKKSKEYDSNDKKKKKSSMSSSKSSSKSSSHKKSSSGKARTFIVKEMYSEEDSSLEEAEVESKEESNSGVASLALASAFVAKSIFNTEDNGHVIDTEANDEDDSALTHCFMARGAKVNSRDAYFQTSSEDDSECNPKPVI